LHVERAIYMGDSFQSPRSARLILAYQRAQTFWPSDLLGQSFFGIAIEIAIAIEKIIEFDLDPDSDFDPEEIGDPPEG
ncbi:MAG: hypothetical protein JW821_06010, partial [Deltaproteobacteria bacterium]|nr:hypothetical protein [Deltaproteobacteria bacterium]